METYDSQSARCPRVCGYRAEKPKVQMKDPFTGPFEKKPTVIEPAYERVGFHLTQVFNITYGTWMPLPADHEIPQGFTISKQCYDYRMATRISIPLYPVFFPTTTATFKRCWELREEQPESGDKYRDAMRAHYERVDPKEEKVYPEIDEEYTRADPYNFYQRKQLCDGYRAIPRFCEDDYKRMFVSEHYPGNPQHQTEFEFPEEEIVDAPIDFMDIDPTMAGKNQKEKNYLMGKVYITNLRNGRRNNGNLRDEVAAYFKVTVRTIWKAARFADACDRTGLAKGIDVMTVVNTPRPMSKIVKHAEDFPEEPWPWGLKDFDYNKRSKPWETFDGERGYAAKEAALRI